MTASTTMEEQVRKRIEALLETALGHPASIYGATIEALGIGYLGGRWVATRAYLAEEQADELLRLHGLWRIYRVISGEETGWVGLPADVAADLFGRPSGPWVIKYEPGRDPGCGRIELSDLARLGGGWTARLADVRAAVDAAARRILQPSRCRACGGCGQISYLDAGVVRCSWCDGRGAVEPIHWPPPGPDGWTAQGAPLNLGAGINWPSPELLAACDRARLFLGTLEYLPLADERAASELRHRLREPSTDVLRDALRFIVGVHPARAGQANLVAEMQAAIRPTPKAPPRPVTSVRDEPVGQALTWERIRELAAMR